MLNDTVIKILEGKEKAYKKSDTNGLYLYVSTQGKKVFRYDYKFLGKRKTFTLGTYPMLSLGEARKMLMDLKFKLENNIDPLAEKQEERQEQIDKLENIFKNVTEKWIEIRLRNTSKGHHKKVNSILTNHIYPCLAERPIKDITSREVLLCIRKIEDKELYETAKKGLSICTQVFTFAIGEGYLEINTLAGLSSQLINVKREHFSFIDSKKVFGKLLYDIDNYPHGILMRIALQIAPRVFLRPSELMLAQWEEVDFEEHIWIIPAERMKLRKKHMVPLSAQVEGYLKELHAITGTTPFLFANMSSKTKTLSIDGLRQALRRIGYGKEVITPHSFRHTASTMLNELGYNADHIEKQLAHSTGSTVRGIYNHAQYLPERRVLMQEWSDFCDKLKTKAEKEEDN